MVTNGIDKKRNQRILKHENNQNQTSLSPFLSHKIWPDIKRQPQNYMIVCKDMRIKHPADSMKMEANMNGWCALNFGYQLRKINGFWLRA